jgi:hypothetical protein
MLWGDQAEHAAVSLPRAAGWVVLETSGAATEGEPMRTLHIGLRVADLERSLAFYTAVGYGWSGASPRPRSGT